MATVEINLTGGSYQHRSLPLSAQRTVNFWPQKQANPKAKSPYILEGWPGKTLFGSVSGGSDRGMFEHQGIVYKVTGTTLYTVASDGTHTSRGTISGTARCIFAPIGSNVVIVSAGSVWQWDGTNLTSINDSDLESPNSAAHINNQILYDGDGGRFCVSDAGDASSIEALNYAAAESEADDLVRVYTFGQTAYLMGEKTIELWWNSGQGNPPFDRIEGGIIRVGLAALHSPASDDDNIYFIGDDLQVYSLRGSASAIVTAISTLPMVQELQTYGTVSDAIGWCMNLDGQWFYILTFPTANKTWAYPIGGEWFELVTGTSGRDSANSYVYAFGKHLVADYASGNIYQLTGYTENGSEIIRLRDSAPLHGGLVGRPGKRLEMNRFELIMETGVGLLSGQGSNPVVMLSFSDDGGKTFSTEMWGEVGKLGSFQQKVEWFCLGSFESRIIRIRVSDPIYWAIHSAAADLEVGI